MEVVRKAVERFRAEQYKFPNQIPTGVERRPGMVTDGPVCKACYNEWWKHQKWSNPEGMVYDVCPDAWLVTNLTTGEKALYTNDSFVSTFKEG